MPEEPAPAAEEQQPAAAEDASLTEPAAAEGEHRTVHPAAPHPACRDTHRKLVLGEAEDCPAEEAAPEPQGKSVLFSAAVANDMFGRALIEALVTHSSSKIATI